MHKLSIGDTVTFTDDTYGIIRTGKVIEVTKDEKRAKIKIGKQHCQKWMKIESLTKLTKTD